MFRRRVSRALAGWLVALLVFAQAAVAANACLAASSARVDALAAAHEACDMQQSNLNLCVYHCADQYNTGGGSPQVIVLAPAPSAPPAPAWNESALSTEAHPVGSRATGPPIPIRHCRFHI